MGLQYWKQYVRDYLSCGMYDNQELTEDKIERIAMKLLEDDEMWNTIDYTAQYYIDRIGSI